MNLKSSMTQSAQRTAFRKEGLDWVWIRPRQTQCLLTVLSAAPTAVLSAEGIFNNCNGNLI